MKRSAFSVVLAPVLMFSTAPVHGTTLLGPLGGAGLSGEYSAFADSPFAALDFSAGYFFLETFEGLDHAASQQFNVPGVSGNNGGPVTQTFGPFIHDSVDLDDGTLDGSGLAGESWFFGNGTAGVTFTFDAAVLGALPTHAGLVWTDGLNPIIFEAFDAGGVSLGTLTGSHATSGFGGQTNSDRFYGVIETGGISAIKMSTLGGGGIELDHLQFGNLGNAIGAPEPATAVLLAIGLAGIGYRRRRAISERR